MSTSIGKEALHQHLINMHPGSRVAQTWTKSYMERAHGSFHRHDPALLSNVDHFSQHIDNKWPTS